MIDTATQEHLQLAERYKALQHDLLEGAKYGRPVCPLLAGDLAAVAGQLGLEYEAKEFLDGLQQKPAEPEPGTLKIRGVVV